MVRKMTIILTGTLVARLTAMAKLAAQLKIKFFGLVGRIASCGRAGAGAAYKDAGNSSAAHAVQLAPSQQKGHPPLLQLIPFHPVVSAAGATTETTSVATQVYVCSHLSMYFICIWSYGSSFLHSLRFSMNSELPGILAEYLATPNFIGGYISTCIPFGTLADP
jgi:hypothetical protein